MEGEGTDDLVRRARKAMVSTYGQTPKKLFAFPHPRPQLQANEACEQEAIDTVWGIRWGHYLGSPASPDLDVINTREYREPVSLFETNSRIVFWPKNTLILGDSVVGTWDATGIRVKANTIYLCIGAEVNSYLIFIKFAVLKYAAVLRPRLCRKLNNIQLYFHRSQRVLELTLRSG